MPYPIMPDAHAVGVMLLILVALLLFARERIPLETTSLYIIVALTLGFALFPYENQGITLSPVEFFSGFGHEALVAICGLMVIGQGMVSTGALEPMARILARQWANYPVLTFLATLIICAILSAFLNNTPIVVLLLPVLMSVALRTNKPPSATMLPMGLATLVGGMATTIGTSTNLLVVGVAADLGLPRFNMFDFAGPVVIAGVVGIAYLWLIAPRLLPVRAAPLEDTSPRVFTAMLHVSEESLANGLALSEVLQKTHNMMRIQEIRRGQDRVVTRLPTVKLRAGDRLLIRDTPENLKEYEEILGATLYREDDLEHPVDKEHPLSDNNQQLAELVVTRISPLNRSTLRFARFAERYQLIPLAIQHAGHQIKASSKELLDIVLQEGDILLIQGSSKQLKTLKQSGDLLVLDGAINLPRTSKASLVFIVTLTVLITAATGLLPISVSALCGAALLLTAGCMTWREAGRALNRQVILLVVASLALGLALVRTGGADYLAQLFLYVTHGASIPIVLSSLMLFMVALTNLVSNSAAAVIGTPIAISIAHQLNVPAEPFVLAILFGANMSYATPMGYQTNLLILSAGGYKFSDFLRVGIPLSLIMWLLLSWLLTVQYQL